MILSTNICWAPSWGVDTLTLQAQIFNASLGAQQMLNHAWSIYCKFTKQETVICFTELTKDTKHSKNLKNSDT